MVDIVEQLDDGAGSIKALIDQKDAEIARLRAEVERLRKGMEEYACTGSDEPCGCYNDFIRDTETMDRLRAEVERLTTMLSENDVLRLMRDAGFDSKEIRMLTYTSWKDGIDIERVSAATMRFVSLVRAALAADGKGE